MHNTYPSSKQWAAVRIHLSLITEPPQYKRLCLIGIIPNNRFVTILPRKLTSHGQSPFVMTFPPMILFFLESSSVKDMIYFFVIPISSITNGICTRNVHYSFPSFGMHAPLILKYIHECVSMSMNLRLIYVSGFIYFVDLYSDIYQVTEVI